MGFQGKIHHFLYFFLSAKIGWFITRKVQIFIIKWTVLIWFHILQLKKNIRVTQSFYLQALPLGKYYNANGNRKEFLYLTKQTGIFLIKTLLHASWSPNLQSASIASFGYVFLPLMTSNMHKIATNNSISRARSEE